MNRRLVAWIVVLMLLGASPAAAQGWAIYNSDPGRFRVDMPGSPTMTTVPVPVGSGQTVPMTEAEVRLRNAVSFGKNFRKMSLLQCSKRGARLTICARRQE